MDSLLQYSHLADKNTLVPHHLKVPKSFSWPYLKYRFLRPVIKAHYRLFRKINQPVPWITPGAIAILNKWLKQDMNVFEWGSGLSTIYFSRKVKHVTSVEHNQEWYHLVQKLLKNNKVEKKASLNFIPEQEPPAVGYQEYADFILSFPDNSFHVILVDGRARVNCVKNAICKLKEGGLLLLDNSERPHYSEAHQLLANWTSVTTTTGLQNTTLYQKPA